MADGGNHNVLCVLPDGSFRLFSINNDYSFTLDSFWSYFKLNPSEFALYSISPSLVQILQYERIVQLNEQFTSSVPDFRLQVLTVGQPNYVLRIYPQTDKNLKLASWNIVFDSNSKFSLNTLNEIFNQTFCVDSEKREFEFEPTFVDLSTPVFEQRDVLNSTTVILKVTMQQKQADYAKRRPKIIDEIIKTESHYVHELINVNESFTTSFFQSLNMSVDIYGRTFKSIREIMPVHEQFLAALQPVGTAVESAIGHVFLEYYSLFKVASPHVCNFAAANDEIKELLHTNKNFSKAVYKICKEKFDGKPIESVIVTPVQRLPRYPLLLKDLIKSTSENHWDYMDLKTAFTKIQELCQNMDAKKREQDELNFVAELQAKIGSQYNVLTTGRRGLDSIENIKMRMKVLKPKSKRDDGENENKNDNESKNEYTIINTKGSIYLFNDAILIWSQSANKFNEESLIPVKLTKKDGVLYITDLCSIAESDVTPTFIQKFEEARRIMIMKQCSYGNAFAWTKMEYETGPPLLSSVSITYYDDTLFLFGGCLPNGKCSNDLWIREEGRWKLLDTIHTPSPRYGCSMAAFDSKLVVFGGRNKTQYLNDLLIYEIKLHTWFIIDCFEKPPGRIGHASALIKVNTPQNKNVIRYVDSNPDDYDTQNYHSTQFYQNDQNDSLDAQLWVFGGQTDDNTYTNDLYIFDFATNQWYNFIDSVMPEPRSYSVSFCMSDNMGFYKFGIQGGRNSNEAFNDLWFFDLQLNQWIKETPGGNPPIPCYGHVAANLNNSIYIFGGMGINKEPTIPYKLSLAKKQIELNKAENSKTDLAKKQNDPNVAKPELAKKQSNLDKCEEQLYIWENIPQCDEPEYFIEGAVAVDSNYGILLFGPTVGYSTIRLIFNDVNQLNCEHALSTEKKMKKITEMTSSALYSRPFYNINTQEVTMKIDSEEQCDFVLEFDQKAFDEFYKENEKSFDPRINSIQVLSYDSFNEKYPSKNRNRTLSSKRSASSFTLDSNYVLHYNHSQSRFENNENVEPQISLRSLFGSQKQEPQKQESEQQFSLDEFLQSLNSLQPEPEIKKDKKLTLFDYFNTTNQNKNEINKPKPKDESILTRQYLSTPINGGIDMNPPNQNNDRPISVHQFFNSKNDINNGNTMPAHPFFNQNDLTTQNQNPDSLSIRQFFSSPIQNGNDLSLPNRNNDNRQFFNPQNQNDLNKDNSMSVRQIFDSQNQNEMSINNDSEISFRGYFNELAQKEQETKGQQNQMPYHDIFDSVNKNEVESAQSKGNQNNEGGIPLRAFFHEQPSLPPPRREPPLVQNNTGNSSNQKPRKKYFALNKGNAPSQATRSSTDLFENRRHKPQINSSREVSDDSMIVFEPESKNHPVFTNMDPLPSSNIPNYRYSTSNFEPIRPAASQTIPGHHPPRPKNSTAHHPAALSLGNLIDISGIHDKK